MLKFLRDWFNKPAAATTTSRSSTRRSLPRFEADEDGKPNPLVSWQDVANGEPSAPSPSASGSSSFRPRTEATQPAAAPEPVQPPTTAVNAPPPHDYGLPSASRHTVLEQLGWTLPERKRGETDLSMLDMSSMKNLTDYEITFDVDELDAMSEAYQGQYGYTPPQGQGDIFEDDDRLTVKADTTRTGAMTQEAYDALTPAQRKAVDYNTAYVAAREKDLDINLAPPSEEELGDYAADYEKIFGEEFNEDRHVYAPNMVGMLKKIDFTAEGQDLDEFMALEHVVSMDELADFDGSDLDIAVPGESGWASDFRSSMSHDNMLAIDAALVDAAGPIIDQALELNPDAWDMNSALSYEFFGHAPEGVDVPWGFGRAADRSDPNDVMKDEWFRTQYNGLRQVGDLDILWGDIRDQDLNEEAQAELFTYLELKTRRDIQLGLIDPQEGEAMGAGEIRALLGFEEVT